mmetsp:Transcript_84651/g.140113  ORF Transcript_84651/g.140113 Transcript_84651/m.140113 type:complete len:136 (-) Transcript_84651:64-471(-)
MADPLLRPGLETKSAPRGSKEESELAAAVMSADCSVLPEALSFEAPRTGPPPPLGPAAEPRQSARPVVSFAAQSAPPVVSFTGPPGVSYVAKAPTSTAERLLVLRVDRIMGKLNILIVCVIILLLWRVFDFIMGK